MTYYNEIYGKSKRYQLCSYYDCIKNDNNKDNLIQNIVDKYKNLSGMNLKDLEKSLEVLPEAQAEDLYAKTNTR